MDLYERLIEKKKKGIPCMLVTVIEKSGEGPVTVGKKMLVSGDGEAYGTVGGGAVEYEARNHCQSLIKTASNDLITYVFNEGKMIEEATTLPMACGGKAKLFFAYEGSEAYVYIFGAGHVGQALARVLKPMNYNITVIDHRKEVMDVFEEADVKVNQSFTDYVEANGIREGSYVIVCTPSHKYDYQVLDKVFEEAYKPKYIGMLCSKTKLKDYLDKTYAKFGPDIDLSDFYAPIGLDTGGGSPEEIAVAIAAEILTVRHEKEGHKHMGGNY